MLEFFVAYIWLAIGFTLAFMILFSFKKSFHDFPGPLISVFIMMLGEMDLDALYYPSKQKFNKTTGELSEINENIQFPGAINTVPSIKNMTF